MLRAGMNSSLSETLVLLKLWGKWLLFPGLDLHTRCRYRFLPRFFQPGPVDTLDAGFGNGALAYAAFKLGNRVLGVTKDPQEVRKARALFSLIGTDTERLNFEICNLYDLAHLGRKFDQIICSETLEHIAQDHIVIGHFFNLLRKKGVLHLCCPFAFHPDHRLGRVNGPEDGGHVRDGYTFESYQALLQPAGFDIVKIVGLGSPFLVKLDKLIRQISHSKGDMAALPVFLLTWPLQYFDDLTQDEPYSLYIKAIKRST
jgi:SAM-dependent methyltransferase